VNDDDFRLSERTVSDVVRRTGSLMIREVGDELLVLDTLTNRIHQLNQTASFVWRMYRDGMPATTIASALVEAFDVEESIALVDVANVLSQMRSLKLLADG
jgi:Coenzyme PQQ synthesis protein D (PqqD)